MTMFFSDRPAARPGIALFLNAGDPPLPVLQELMLELDRIGVDCLELAVPFPDSVSDGPVIRRSALRALANGVDLHDTLAFIAATRLRLRRMKIALLADWSHTVRPRGMSAFLPAVWDSGADAVLVHGLPPRLHPAYYDSARRLDLPVVTTCYATSSQTVRRETGEQATGYLYLVAHYGRTGAAPGQGYTHLEPVLRELRGITRAPIAVGFGVRTRSDVAALHEAGADAAIIGSAGVARIEDAIAAGSDPVAGLRHYASELMGEGDVADAGEGA